MSFTVYVHITPSDKRYVGITSTTTEHRWGKNGENYKHQPYFWKAIQKYGWDNIEHVVIATDLSEIEACKMEQQLISEYKSNISKFGYNISAGGESPFYGIKRNKTWCANIAKSMSGNLNRVHKNSPEERKRISNRMLGNNYGSRRHITDEYRQKALESQPNRVIIEQYTLDGKLVATYRSVNEAHKITGIWNIAEASRENGRSKTAGGYIWARKGN